MEFYLPIKIVTIIIRIKKRRVVHFLACIYIKHVRVENLDIPVDDLPNNFLVIFNAFEGGVFLRYTWELILVKILKSHLRSIENQGFFILLNDDAYAKRIRNEIIIFFLSIRWSPVSNCSDFLGPIKGSLLWRGCCVCLNPGGVGWG